MEQPTPRVRYSDSDLAEFKALIEAKLEEALYSYKQLKESLDQTNESSVTSTSRGIEDAADYSEREYLIAMLGRQQKYIQNLERALTRIANKTYGICQVTGKLIDKKRLMLVPHTTQSVEAKLRR